MVVNKLLNSNPSWAPIYKSTAPCGLFTARNQELMWIRTRKKMAYINIFPTFENDESWGAHQTNFHSTKSTGTPYMDCARYLYRSVRGSRLWFHSIRFSSTTLLPRYAAPVIKTRAYRCWPARPDQTRHHQPVLYFTCAHCLPLSQSIAVQSLQYMC